MSLPNFPKTLARSQIEEIITNSTGRDVDFFYVYSSYPCPNPDDSYDPVTDTSTNSFCPICSGIYWIPTYSGVTMSGHVTWKFDYKNEFETGGRVFIGDVQVKVMHTEDRERFIKDDVKYLVVDDIVVDIVKITKLGNPPNRLIVSCKEREEE